MFFSISKTPHYNFSHQHKLGPFVVGTDAGWTAYQHNQYTCLYKGYVDSAKIESVLTQILNQSEPELFGNFCVLAYNSVSKSIKIKSDRYRSFPIYFNSEQVSNLNKLDSTVWSDSVAEVTSDFLITQSKFNLIGHIDTDYTTIDEVVEKIDIILTKKTQDFLRYNDRPIRAFLSGGVDSLLVYSYLQKFSTEFELVSCQHVDYDSFWLKNSGTLTNLWSYNQIHHWISPCILTSGTPGDEFMLRGPPTVNLFVRLHGQHMTDLLTQAKWQSSLQHTYFNSSKNLTIFQNDDPLPNWNRVQMIWNLCNIVANDWQHWHLGNTLTWTPLRDLEIFKLLLRLPVDAAMGQIMNSDISRRLIEKNCHGLSRVMSAQKNSGNAMENLVDLLL